MMKSTALSCVLGSILAAGLDATAAWAASGRTWVSGNGADTGTCTRIAPCATFAYALTQTSSGGEIDVVDSGGYGTVAINQSVSIVNDGAGVAGILVGGNATGININGNGSPISVTLRGLTINGFNANSSFGIIVADAGAVSVQNCLIQGLGGPGIEIEPSPDNLQMKIQETTVTRNGSGVLIQVPFNVEADIAVERSRIDRNSGGGIKAQSVGGTVKIELSDSSVSHNTSNGINAVSVTNGFSIVDATRAVISGNGLLGIQANSSAGGAVQVGVGGTTLTFNGGGQINGVGGGNVIGTYGNNQTAGPAPINFNATFPLK